jgi:tripartite-type tricarboxylate transporter receptor subunit TctC
MRRIRQADPPDYSFAAGGGTDLTARAIAMKLTEAWGQTVVPDNRAGANGTIGVDIATKSPPDGYTLTMISSSHSVNSSLYKLPYDLSRDLAPITQATTQPYALVVHPSVCGQIRQGTDRARQGQARLDDDTGRPALAA